jgi:hypothetical protein
MKRGVSHVEVIISFVIFITFLAFIYSIIEPALKSPTDKSYSADILKTNLLNYVGSDVSVYKVTLDFFDEDCTEMEEDSVISSCFKIDHSLNQNALVFDETDETTRDYYNEIGLLSIWCGGCENGDVFSVYNSEEFEPSDKVAGCSDSFWIPGCYNEVFEGTKKYVFKEKLENLSIEYEENWLTDSGKNLIRAKLGSSSSGWFWFALLDSDGESIIVEATDEGFLDIPEDANVYSDNIPIVYLDDNNKATEGFLLIKSW